MPILAAIAVSSEFTLYNLISSLSFNTVSSLVLPYVSEMSISVHIAFFAQK